jgi:hypothetical protein
MLFYTRYSTGMRYPNRTFFVFNATESAGAGHMIRCVRFANEFINRELEIHHIGIIEIDWLKESRFNKLFSTSSDELNFIPSSNDIFIVDSYENRTLDFYHEIAKKHLVFQMIDSSTELIPNAFYFSLDPLIQKFGLIKIILKNWNGALNIFRVNYFRTELFQAQLNMYLLLAEGAMLMILH